MKEIEKYYFDLKYKNRIEMSIKNIEKSNEISTKKEREKFLHNARKENLQKNPVNKNYIKMKLKELKESKRIEFSDVDTTYKVLEEDFADYHFIYENYYNENRNDLFLEHDALLKWYKEQNNCCGYCGISKDELEKIAINRGESQGLQRNLTLNGGKKRSKGTLEIERVDSESNEYSFTNVILACPLCNNAKSNLIDEKGWRAFFVLPMRKYYEELLLDTLKNPIPKKSEVLIRQLKS